LSDDIEWSGTGTFTGSFAGCATPVQEQISDSGDGYINFGPSITISGWGTAHDTGPIQTMVPYTMSDDDFTYHTQWTCSSH
jgi:hypothetical protein